MKTRPTVRTQDEQSALPLASPAQRAQREAAFVDRRSGTQALHQLRDAAGHAGQTQHHQALARLADGSPRVTTQQALAQRMQTARQPRVSSGTRGPLQRVSFSVPSGGELNELELPARDPKKGVKTKTKVDGQNSYASGFGLEEENSRTRWHTQIEWATPSGDGEGKKMVAHPLGPDHPLGSVPEKDGFSAARRDVLNALTGDSYTYICGHLLNHHVGGPGTRNNLAAIPSSANGFHESKIEDPVKKLVNNQLLWIHYEITVDYTKRKLSEINGQWSKIGSALTTPWSKQSNSPLNDNAEIPVANAFNARWYVFDEHGKPKKETSKTLAIPFRGLSSVQKNAPALAGGGSQGKAAKAKVPSWFKPLNHPTAEEKPDLDRGPKPTERRFPYIVKNKPYTPVNVGIARDKLIADTRGLDPFTAELDTNALKARLIVHITRQANPPTLFDSIARNWVANIKDVPQGRDPLPYIVKVNQIRSKCWRWDNLMRRRWTPKKSDQPQLREAWEKNFSALLAFQESNAPPATVPQLNKNYAFMKVERERCIQAYFSDCEIIEREIAEAKKQARQERAAAEQRRHQQALREAQRQQARQYDDLRNLGPLKRKRVTENPSDPATASTSTTIEEQKPPKESKIRKKRDDRKQGDRGRDDKGRDDRERDDKGRDNRRGGGGSTYLF